MEPTFWKTFCFFGGETVGSPGPLGAMLGRYVFNVLLLSVGMPANGGFFGVASQPVSSAYSPESQNRDTAELFAEKK